MDLTPTQLTLCIMILFTLGTLAIVFMIDKINDRLIPTNEKQTLLDLVDIAILEYEANIHPWVEANGHEKITFIKYPSEFDPTLALLLNDFVKVDLDNFITFQYRINDPQGLYALREKLQKGK